MEQNRVQKGLELQKSGYNCAQSVFCAYSDLFGIGEPEAFRLSEGMGGGIGGLRRTCGAVSGMALLAGLKNSGGSPAGRTKQSTYQLVQQMVRAFEEKNSSSICAELLGMNGGPKLRSCPGCVEDACRIVEQYLLEEPEK